MSAACKRIMVIHAVAARAASVKLLKEATA
ncbi:hypothetical protein A4R44_02415 [Amycolatopsis sp. M39]|uniref:Uncharacterized protein n=1 Tax=Amycolatopsis rubida TaxID=112413 RepID=A0A1I5Q764_9PSEU|nr:hypothetical protein A4R44_02415 [Amycolatopsis sp. M39]SFP41726.1 hypothetical protein SAMN05421854_105204 [Amycolatopsis rubida]